MGYVGGVDVGSAFVKAIIMDGNKLISSQIVPAAGAFEHVTKKALIEASRRARLSFDSLDWIASTGYYYNVCFTFPTRNVSVLSSNGKGAVYLFPSVRTVIDIGMQRTSVIKVDHEGNVLDSTISEKCAAGSGWLLQVTARVLGINMEDMGSLSLRSQKKIEFTSDCAVFAETEAVARVSEGSLKEDILAGVHRALATKIGNLVKRVGLERDCALIGGGAKNVGLVESVTQELGVAVRVPPEPLLVTALGAVLTQF